MKRYLVLLLFIGQACIDQSWEAKVMAGLSGYNDDLTAKLFTPKSIRPAAGPNFKYNYNDIFTFREGIGRVSANNKNNHQRDRRCRNLGFHRDIPAANFCVEINLFEPEFIYSLNIGLTAGLKQQSCPMDKEMPLIPLKVT
ncbi:MAG: hypothetical protein ACHQFX_11850 [Chitinophagales bacterium]